MKSKFTTIDLIAIVAELKERVIGMRVVQVYDADQRTYLIKLQRPESKTVLLVESGCRIHTTEYEWPKNPAPSGFAMKLRKHLRNKRLESVRQLGVDRIVDLQFGSGEMAHHLLLELYDRGNLVLTDWEYTILNILRPRTDTEDVRFAVREKYPVDKCRQYERRTEQQLLQALQAAKPGELLRKVINPHLDFGPALIDHLLLEVGLPPQPRLGHEFLPERDLHLLVSAVKLGETVVLNQQQDFKGIITYKLERRSAAPTQPTSGTDDVTEITQYQDFHPLLFHQHEHTPHLTFVTFTAAVDEFFSKLESQKLDMKTVQQERDALKKLENVRRDHERRLAALELAQRQDRWRAELISVNAGLVDGAALVVRSALANQMDWRDIRGMVQQAQKRGDPVASTIKALKLESNHITMLLSDPYHQDSDDELDDDSGGEGSEGQQDRRQEADPAAHIRPMLVDIDLDLSALANARRYFDMKRSAAKKQQKTIESSYKAMKSAEKKTKQTLKEAATIASINRARRVHWFEKFLWFISSENYLVLGGRDQQQNEILVRRYLRPGDVYVHADLHGATSLVVKNPAGGPVPPKTLNEAGVFAVSNSSAWDAKIVTSAWWVNADQVSKTAPTGEYLTTGSFMVRGRKNYLPPCHLTLAFGVLFRLEQTSVARHRGERRVRTLDTEDSVPSSADGTEGTEQQEEEVAPAGSDGETSEPTDDLRLSSADQRTEDQEDSPADAEVGADADGSSEVEADRGGLGGGEVGGEGSDEVGEDLSGGESDEDRTVDSGEEEAAPAGPDSDASEAVHRADGVPDQPETGQDQLFPDTSVEVKHLKGGRFTVAVSSPDQQTIDNPFPPLPQPKARRGGNKVNPAGRQDSQTKQSQQRQPRGRRTKMKRAKEKYKDQDEEERQARMAILQSAGKARTAAVSADVQTDRLGSGKQQRGPAGGRQQQQRGPAGSRQQQQQQRGAAPAVDEDQPDEEESAVPQDCQILEEFTGIPLEEDELLYAIPVCAPHSTLLSYKYKVKLTPGPGKKGKAAKSSLQVFLNDKSATARERDLLKSIKLEDVARNMPGKVKVTVPQAQRPKKR